MTDRLAYLQKIADHLYDDLENIRNRSLGCNDGGPKWTLYQTTLNDISDHKKCYMAWHKTIFRAALSLPSANAERVSFKLPRDAGYSYCDPSEMDIILASLIDGQHGLQMMAKFESVIILFTSMCAMKSNIERRLHITRMIIHMQRIMQTGAATFHLSDAVCGYVMTACGKAPDKISALIDVNGDDRLEFEIPYVAGIMNGPLASAIVVGGLVAHTAGSIMSKADFTNQCLAIMGDLPSRYRKYDSVNITIIAYKQ